MADSRNGHGIMKHTMSLTVIILIWPVIVDAGSKCLHIYNLYRDVSIFGEFRPNFKLVFNVNFGNTFDAVFYIRSIFWCGFCWTNIFCLVTRVNLCNSHKLKEIISPFLRHVRATSYVHETVSKYTFLQSRPVPRCLERIGFHKLTAPFCSGKLCKVTRKIIYIFCS
jgi:hypothetical protein